MINPEYIANLITDDPDVFVEEDSSANSMRDMTSSEISKQVENTVNPTDAIKQREKSQQDAQKKLDAAKKKMLEPQFKAMDASLKKINQSIDQASQDQEQQQAKSNAITSEVNIISNLLKNFQKASM